MWEGEIRTYGIASVVEKLRGKGLQWYSHMIHADGNPLAKISLNIGNDGKRSKGRPGKNEIDTVDSDLRAT